MQCKLKESPFTFDTQESKNKNAQFIIPHRNTRNVLCNKEQNQTFLLAVILSMQSAVMIMAHYFSVSDNKTIVLLNSLTNYSVSYSKMKLKLLYEVLKSCVRTFTECVPST